MPDLNMESDMKLDKLESFLGKLNSKGQSSSLPTLSPFSVRVENPGCCLSRTHQKAAVFAASLNFVVWCF